jgi:hypothetical protein
MFRREVAAGAVAVEHRMRCFLGVKPAPCNPVCYQCVHSKAAGHVD